MGLLTSCNVLHSDTAPITGSQTFLNLYPFVKDLRLLPYIVGTNTLWIIVIVYSIRYFILIGKYWKTSNTFFPNPSPFRRYQLLRCCTASPTCSHSLWKTALFIPYLLWLRTSSYDFITLYTWGRYGLPRIVKYYLAHRLRLLYAIISVDSVWQGNFPLDFKI